MTDDFIKAGILATADDYERQHVATAATSLDDSLPVRGRFRGEHIPDPCASYVPNPAHDPLTRLDRAERELIEAWGVLHQIPGFRPHEGETLPAAMRRALSAANQKD